MLLRRKAGEKSSEEHVEINERLAEQERRMEEMARRVRVLEIEAGIYRPLKEVNGS